MIVSASYRTDIPAFYADWLLARIKAGFCDVVNPYGGRPYRVALTPEAVDGLVFWTKNLGPLAPSLPAIRARGYPFYVHYTVTAYPAALERSVVAPERALADIRSLAGRFGPRAAVWRYDPVLITDLTPPAWHRETFRRLADALAGYVDEVVVSFATVYRKTERNLAAAARAHGFRWRDPEDEDKRALLAELAGAARARGLAFTLCAQPALAVAGATPARCIDAVRLSDLAGRAVGARVKGNREGCLCAESRDIGAYDTCPHGCVYCYAVSSPAAARRGYRAHDPRAETLGPEG